MSNQKVELKAVVEVPLLDALPVPRRAWWDALVGVGGANHQKLIKNSGCSCITLKSGDPATDDLRSASVLFVEVFAPSKRELDVGIGRVNKVLDAVKAAHATHPPPRPEPLPPPPPTAFPRLQPPVAAPAARQPAPAEARGAAPSAAQPPAASAWTRPAALAQQPLRSGGSGAACDICMAGVAANVALEPCGHSACAACVMELRKTAVFNVVAGVLCPFCRASVTGYTAPDGVDVGAKPAPAPEQTLAFRATLPPLEIRRPPPATVVALSAREREEAARMAHPAYKSSLCTHWEASRSCDFGDRCNFAHGPGELKAHGRPMSEERSPSPERTAHPKYKRSLCTHWEASRSCDFGDRCNFAHGPGELRARGCHMSEERSPSPELHTGASPQAVSRDAAPEGDDFGASFTRGQSADIGGRDSTEEAALQPPSGAPVAAPITPAAPVAAYVPPPVAQARQLYAQTAPAPAPSTPPMAPPHQPAPPMAPPPPAPPPVHPPAPVLPSHFPPGFLSLFSAPPPVGSAPPPLPVWLAAAVPAPPPPPVQPPPGFAGASFAAQPPHLPSFMSVAAKAFGIAEVATSQTPQALPHAFSDLSVHAQQYQPPAAVHPPPAPPATPMPWDLLF